MPLAFVPTSTTSISVPGMQVSTRAVSSSQPARTMAPLATRAGTTNFAGKEVPSKAAMVTSSGRGNDAAGGGRRR